MMLGFEILLDCNKVLELRKEDTTWVPTDWTDYMDPVAMTTLLGDHICNIEKEEYWEACQHTLKSPYKQRANDGDKEGGTTPSDDEDGSEDKSDSSSSDDSGNDRGHDDDDAAPIVTTTAEVMIARTVEMIGVNPLVIEKTEM